MKYPRLIEIKKIASTFKHRSDFMKANYNDYMYAYKAGILDDICSHMKSKRKWTDGALAVEALKYSSKQEFHKESPAAYQTAYTRGLIENLCSHMTKKLKWTTSLLTVEALKYTSKQEFRELSYAAYQTAYTRGILKKVCSHMTKKLKWTGDALATEAAKYCNKQEFRELSYAAYQTAYMRGILDKIVSVFILSGHHAYHVAAQCNTYEYFYTHEAGAYRAALEFGVLDTIRNSFSGEIVPESWIIQPKEPVGDLFRKHGINPADVR